MNDFASLSVFGWINFIGAVWYSYSVYKLWNALQYRKTSIRDVLSRESRKLDHYIGLALIIFAQYGECLTLIQQYSLNRAASFHLVAQASTYLIVSWGIAMLLGTVLFVISECAKRVDFGEF